MAVVRAVRGPGAREGGSGILLAARLETLLPSGFTFTRAAGPGSYQDAAAVNGTTFIRYFTSGNADVPRFHYFAAAGRRMLLVEPARTNVGLYSDWVDSTGDNVPDNWSLTAGMTPGTDCTTPTGGPHGGRVFQIEDTAFSSPGANAAVSGSAGTLYAYSVWIRATSLGGSTSAYAFTLSPGFATFTVGSGSYDWTRHQVTGTTSGVPSDYYMRFVDDPTGVARFVLPQLEAGAYVSTWIPTAGSTATRNAERCQISTSLVNGAKGAVSFLWLPMYSNTEVTGSPRLFAWGTNDYVTYDGATDTIRVVNNSVVRATSAALTFGRETLHRIRVDYGSFGTKLSVDGVETTDTNAWVAPATLSPHLGSDSSGGNVESAGYADLLTAA